MEKECFSALKHQEVSAEDDEKLVREVLVSLGILIINWLTCLSAFSSHRKNIARQSQRKVQISSVKERGRRPEGYLQR